MNIGYSFEKNLNSFLSLIYFYLLIIYDKTSVIVCVYAFFNMRNIILVDDNIMMLLS